MKVVYVNNPMTPALERDVLQIQGEIRRREESYRAQLNQEPPGGFSRPEATAIMQRGFSREFCIFCMFMGGILGTLCGLALAYIWNL